METLKITQKRLSKLGRKRLHTNFLASSPSFLSGAATVMNLAGNFYKFNTSRTGRIADYKALSQDFRMIGQDIQDAFEAESAKLKNSSSIK